MTDVCWWLRTKTIRGLRTLQNWSQACSCRLSLWAGCYAVVWQGLYLYLSRFDIHMHQLKMRKLSINAWRRPKLVCGMWSLQCSEITYSFSAYSTFEFITHSSRSLVWYSNSTSLLSRVIRVFNGTCSISSSEVLFAFYLELCTLSY